MGAHLRLTAFFVAVFSAISAGAGGIGFLDTERAIREVREGQQQLAILSAWADEKTEEVEAVRNRVVELSRQLDEQRSVASEETIARLQQDLLQAQRDLEDAGRAVKRDFERKQRELLAEVAIRVRDVASRYGAANGFDAIFAIEAQPLVYIANSAVITDAVIRKYDELYPVK